MFPKKIYEQKGKIVMAIIEKARELGMMLAQSKEFTRMKNAELAQQADSDAQLLLAKYNTTREEIMQKAQKENITPEEMQQIRNEMEQEYATLQGNANIVEYIEAMSEFNDLMQGVNGAISDFISPESGSCDSGDCGSCGGGCH